MFNLQSEIASADENGRSNYETCKALNVDIVDKLYRFATSGSWVSLAEVTCINRMLMKARREERDFIYINSRKPDIEFRTMNQAEIELDRKTWEMNLSRSDSFGSFGSEPEAKSNDTLPDGFQTLGK